MICIDRRVFDLLSNLFPAFIWNTGISNQRFHQGVDRSKGLFRITGFFTEVNTRYCSFAESNQGHSLDLAVNIPNILFYSGCYLLSQFVKTH